MIIRGYQPSDCMELTELFYHTVHTANAKDYTQEQLDVWATEQVDLKKWDRSLREHFSVVAVDGGKIVGFGDIDETGYLDRLYVHAGYQRNGVGTAICGKLEEAFRGILLPMPRLRRGPFLRKGGIGWFGSSRWSVKGFCLRIILWKNP